jgi:hypothetical protein
LMAQASMTPICEMNMQIRQLSNRC